MAQPPNNLPIEPPSGGSSIPPRKPPAPPASTPQTPPKPPAIRAMPQHT